MALVKLVVALWIAGAVGFLVVLNVVKALYARGAGPAPKSEPDPDPDATP